MAERARDATAAASGASDARAGCCRNRSTGVFGNFGVSNAGPAAKPAYSRSSRAATVRAAAASWSRVGAASTGAVAAAARASRSEEPVASTSARRSVHASRTAASTWRNEGCGGRGAGGK